MSASFRLLHFHIGSQIPDILIIKRAVRERRVYYAKLRKMGHPVEYLDVGGGLAIDYDGSRSTFHSSMNYTVESTARQSSTTSWTCATTRRSAPTIRERVGAPSVAHYSVLVVQAFGSIEKTRSNRSTSRRRSTSSSRTSRTPRST